MHYVVSYLSNGKWITSIRTNSISDLLNEAMRLYMQNQTVRIQKKSPLTKSMSTIQIIILGDDDSEYANC